MLACLAGCVLNSECSAACRVGTPGTLQVSMMQPQSVLLLGCRYTGSQGIYTHTVAYERNVQCPVCSAGVELNAPQSSTLQQVGSLLKPRRTCQPKARVVNSSSSRLI